MATGDYMVDLSSAMNVSAASSIALKHSDNKDRTSLDMDDFLNLMVVTLQNQTIDNTTDMSEMMNQMVQMSVMQAITDISSLIEDSTSLNYAAGLVGKNVTVGNWQGDQLVEIEGTVTGTGTLNGQQVVFLDDGEQAYTLNSILAIGRLPEKIIAPGETAEVSGTESATGTVTETEGSAETVTETETTAETGTQGSGEEEAYTGESGYDT